MERMTGMGGGAAKVGVWCRVIVQDVETDEKLAVTVVPFDVADPFVGRISIGSPLAEALMGHQAHESVHIKIHDGTRTFRIVKVARGPVIS